MPALVLAYAVDLRRRGRGWRAIVEDLERTGNGRYDVRTLTRRIVQVLAGQNRAELAAAAAAGDVAGVAVKTRLGRARAARPGRRLERRSKPGASRRRPELAGMTCTICHRKIRPGEATYIGMSGYAFHTPRGRGEGHTFPPPATCRECGCTDAAACPGGCSWVEPDLCSGCAPASAFPLSESETLEA